MERKFQRVLHTSFASRLDVSDDVRSRLLDPPNAHTNRKRNCVAWARSHDATRLPSRECFQAYIVEVKEHRRTVGVGVKRLVLYDIRLAILAAWQLTLFRVLRTYSPSVSSWLTAHTHKVTSSTRSFSAWLANTLTLQSDKPTLVSVYVENFVAANYVSTD